MLRHDAPEKILVLHGPNLNLLGTREPHIYGTTTLEQLNERLRTLAAKVQVQLVIVQSNHEGVLVDTLHKHMGEVAGAILNPAGLTQFGVSLHDAIKTMPSDPGQEPPPARLVLMSDGETTTGRPNARAVAAASDADVPVSTIAFGTPNGSIVYDGQQIRVPVNAPALKDIAQSTKGSFFEAASEEELKKVYADVGTSIGYVTEPKEITVWFVGAALALAAAAAAGSLVWFARLP